MQLRSASRHAVPVAPARPRVAPWPGKQACRLRLQDTQLAHALTLAFYTRTKHNLCRSTEGAQPPHTLRSWAGGSGATSQAWNLQGFHNRHTPYHNIFTKQIARRNAQGTLCCMLTVLSWGSAPMKRCAEGSASCTHGGRDIFVAEGAGVRTSLTAVPCIARLLRSCKMGFMPLSKTLAGARRDGTGGGRAARLTLAYQP